jgi:uncharacterized RDD family membrane protein YckC
MRRREKYFFERIFARVIDYLFLLLIANLFSLIGIETIGIFGIYILYNLLLALFQGRSLGKWVLRLEVKATRAWSYFLREVFFFLLFPLIVIHFCFSSSRVLHEILSNSYLVKK